MYTGGVLMGIHRLSWVQVLQNLLQITVKGEASPSIYADWVNGKSLLETYQQKFGQIWIVQSKAMIFQSYD